MVYLAGTVQETSCQVHRAGDGESVNHKRKIKTMRSILFVEERPDKIATFTVALSPSTLEAGVTAKVDFGLTLDEVIARSPGRDILSDIATCLSTQIVSALQAM